jgi:crossover junction endodeoxyribonuclease RusA
MGTKTITLPLPSRNLSPNSRVHWSKLAEHKKAARRMAALETWNQVESVFAFKGYRLDFYWPTKRRRDKDNAAAMCKAYLDGVADCTSQDDSEWDFDGVRFEIDRDNPRLEIVFTEL